MLNIFDPKITINEITHAVIDLGAVGTRIDNQASNIDNSRFVSSVVHTMFSDHNTIIFRAELTWPLDENMTSSNSDERVINPMSVAIFFKPPYKY